MVISDFARLHKANHLLQQPDDTGACGEMRLGLVWFANWYSETIDWRLDFLTKLKMPQVPEN